MLALAHLSKSYGSRRVLDDVSLDVRRGELLGFVGGNGAGKTTTMRIVLGVATPDAGDVTLDGRPLDVATRARIGYMPEERGLYPAMGVAQQLEFFARLHGATRLAARRAVHYWLERLGLDQRRDSRLEDLSLGNQQRVQLAAALVHEPDALVLDEPFSGLDPLAVDVMSEVLREEAARGVPVVFSSHQLDLVERTCDRVGILRSGRVVASGTVGELTGHDALRHLVRTDAESAAWTREVRASGIDVGPVPDDPGAVTVTLGAPGNLQHVVDVVRRHGDLLELRPWRPSLTQVYRDVVDAGHHDPTTSAAGTAAHDRTEQMA